MRRKCFKIYRQLDAMDCGPSCLRMILSFYGKEMPLKNIREAAEIGKNGVSLLGLSMAAEKFGFHTTSVKITLDQLLDAAVLPCVLYWDQEHFVVLTPLGNKRSFSIADPAKGIMTFKREEFLKHWITLNEDGESRGIALLLTPRATFNDQTETTKHVGWWLLAKYAFKYKALLFKLFVGLLVGSLIQLLFPYLAQSIVDTGILTQNVHFLQIILIAQFVLFFSRTMVELIRSRILLFVSTHINLSILSDFWIKLMRLPLSFFETKLTGDIFQRINDHNRIETFITGTALQTLFSVVNLITFSIVLLFYSTNIFLIFSVGSVLYLLWIRLFLKYRRTIDYERFSLSSKETGMTMQLINGMQEIKLHNAEHLKRWEWESIRASLFKITFRSLSINQYQQIGAFFINEGKNIIITYFVALSVIDGNLTLGAMLAIQYIIGQLNGPIEQLVSFSRQAQDANISLERLNEIHELEEEEPDNKKFITSIPPDSRINFSHLTFIYPGAGNEPILRNLNLTIESGKITALVGMSGSGKTTVLKLLQKIHYGYAGEIKIGDINLKYISPYYWRSLSGSVMQEGYIFNDTIERNISVGDDNPDYAKLIAACKVANIFHFIEELPLGFNTKIGAEGKGLSAGQRQRILIARVVYKEPSFIFFDEATNALDATNEKMIMENLQAFFTGKTVLIVAHRLSTVKNADKIIVLQNGEIVEQGKHKDLAEQGGKYYELVKNQLEFGK